MLVGVQITTANLIVHAHGSGQTAEQPGAGEDD
jgi:hypothetical protein